MPVSRDFLDHLVELLEPVGAVETRRMFGGAGLFHPVGPFFGGVDG